MADSKNKLVWSDDPKDRLKSDGFVDLKWVCVFRLEKNGRGGKTVTVLDQLPRQEAYVSDLCKELKSKCGSGGTYRLLSDRGVIEIQGDQRGAIKSLFEKMGIRYKGM